VGVMIGCMMGHVVWIGLIFGREMTGNLIIFGIAGLTLLISIRKHNIDLYVRTDLVLVNR